MAYIDQQKKSALAPNIKTVFKKYGVKGSIAVRNHMVLVVTIKSGVIDFISNFNKLGKDNEWKNPYGTFNDVTGSIDVNPYHYREQFDGIARDFLNDLIIAMNDGNHDNSDIQSDYFDVGWYIDVNIGKWDRPYEFAG